MPPSPRIHPRSHAQLRSAENQAASSQLCSSLEARCEAELDDLQAMRLPSLRKFESSHRRCERRFTEQCKGPGRKENAERLAKAWARASKQFARDYNNNLYTGLLVLSLCGIVIFRFVWRVQIIEAACWVGFLFLEVYPHVHPGPGTMYDTKGWQVTVQAWEGLMLALFGFRGAPAVWVVALAAVVVLRLHRRRQQRKNKVHTTGGTLRDLDV